ncbi:MAG: phage holin family protein [Actinomycetota bacterium]|nr:phage holin family protein [Actinomycetota bacterium]
MPTRETDSGGVGSAAKRVAEHASALARLKRELASLEVKQKVTRLAVGIGLALTGVVFGLFALGFGLATIAAALATALDTWLALLIVFAALLVLTAVLVLVGVGLIKRGTPPVPEQAIEEARVTAAVLKGNGG